MVKTNYTDILARIQYCFDNPCNEDDQEEKMLIEAKTALVNAEFDKTKRQEAVTLVGTDPWSWVVISNFGDLEESGQDNVIVVFPDGEEVEAPLLY